MRFPKGSKLLRFVNVSDGGSIDAKVGLPKTALIGIPKEPSQFLAEACKLVHPTTMAMSVGGDVGAEYSFLQRPQWSLL